MAFKILLLAAAFLVAVACAQSPTSNCGIYSSCATCTPMGGCGWCTYSGTCEAGNSTGSFVGCTGSWWIWTIGYCPATPAPTPTVAPTSLCASYTTCATCTPHGGCGWCSFNNQCQQGNSSGSVEGCVSPYWDWVLSQCPTSAPTAMPTPVPVPTEPVTDCSQYTSCNYCTGVNGCGWCSTAYQCQQGTSTGNNQGTCSGANWAWTTAQCSATPVPTPANTCSQHLSCSTCTPVSPCGWCFLTASCQGGNVTGNYGGTCSGPNWAWSTSQCAVTPAPVPTPVNTCSTSTTCQSCTGQANCGWCVYSNVCLVGNQTCSYNGACTGAGWAWTYNTCPAIKKE